MKAVNLLPSDLRGAAPASAAVASGDQAAGRLGAFAVLGVLGFCVVALAAYVLTSNTVKDRQAKLDQVTAQTAAVSAQAAKLKPYADFQSSAQSRIQTVTDLASARFDWARSLRDISRAVPADVTLTHLLATISTAATSGGADDTLRGSIASPAVSLQGCSTGQTAVAGLLARLHAVRGVTRVSISKSVRSDPSTTGAPTDGTVGKPCHGKRPPDFSVVVFFERADTPATVQDVTTGPTSTPASATGSASGASASGTATTGTTDSSASGTATTTSTPATTTP
jgi:Tfp pilus assembly protein PilN